MKMALILIIAAAATAVLIVSLHPLLVRYALARPNARSSHSQPTPQGGGIAVLAATIIAIAVGFLVTPPFFGSLFDIALPLASAVILAIVGLLDDIRPLSPPPRLLLQALAALIVVAALPPDVRLLPILPWWIERAILFVAIVWFVNLVNFMDGIDWMTVAEVVPITAALAAFGLMGALPPAATALSFGLCGAMLGFAPFNRPVARLFLGDVGSLPIGLLLGWLLTLLAGNGHLAAALLLPLYYLADATITLLRRLAQGEPIMQAHRSHFYQRATNGGFSVSAIVGRVFLLNCALVALAAVAVLTASRLTQAAALVAGCFLVGLVLRQFERRKR